MIDQDKAGKPEIQSVFGSIQSKRDSDLLIKVIIVGLVNLIIMIVLVFLLVSLPKKAQDLKRLKSLKNRAIQTDPEAIKLEIAASLEKADKIAAIFPDEAGLVAFIQEIDKLKKDKLVVNFSFASDDVVKDKTGFPGLPLVLEFRGTWAQINQALKNLYQLPFFIRAITIEVKQIPEENQINFKFGGILYVSQNFGND